MYSYLFLKTDLQFIVINHTDTAKFLVSNWLLFFKISWRQQSNNNNTALNATEVRNVLSTRMGVWASSVSFFITVNLCRYYTILNLYHSHIYLFLFSFSVVCMFKKKTKQKTNQPTKKKNQKKTPKKTQTKITPNGSRGESIFHSIHNHLQKSKYFHIL